MLVQLSVRISVHMSTHMSIHMCMHIHMQRWIQTYARMSIHASIYRYRCGGGGTAGDEEEVEGACEHDGMDDDVESEGLVEDATSSILVMTA